MTFTTGWQGSSGVSDWTIEQLPKTTMMVLEFRTKELAGWAAQVRYIDIDLL